MLDDWYHDVCVEGVRPLPEDGLGRQEKKVVRGMREAVLGFRDPARCVAWGNLKGVCVCGAGRETRLIFLGFASVI